MYFCQVYHDPAPDDPRAGASGTRRLENSGVTFTPALDRCESELRKAEESPSVKALWHLARALSILVAYLRSKEQG